MNLIKSFLNEEIRDILEEMKLLESKLNILKKCKKKSIIPDDLKDAFEIFKLRDNISSNCNIKLDEEIFNDDNSNSSGYSEDINDYVDEFSIESFSD